MHAAGSPWRTLVVPGLLALAVLLAPTSRAAAQAPSTHPKLVVLGFDGADAHLTEEYMDEGYLPNLARLRETGTYSRLGTTTPPQTPVSWSSFATGINPGRTGIFDFLRRDLKTYQPDFAMYQIGSKKVLWGKHNNALVALVLLAVSILLGLVLGAVGRRAGRGLLIGAGTGILLGVLAFFVTKDWLPYHRPTVVNTQKGDTFWEVAGRHGIRSEIVRVPATFPAEAFENGKLLSGLGVPDIRGTFGSFSYWTTEAVGGKTAEDTEMGGKIIPISLLNGEADSYIFGPRNRLFDSPPDIEPPVHFKVDRKADPPTVTITTSGETQTVPLGKWSDWFTLKFTFSPVVHAFGTARFFFVSSEPFGLYMSPINIDPHHPVLTIAAPKKWSGEIGDKVGPYKTLGWAIDTWALNEGKIDEKTFLEDAYATDGKFADIMHHLMDEGNYDLYVQVYAITDRVAHVFWRFLDPGHPAYDPVLAAKYKDSIRGVYQFMDKTVGEAMQKMGPNDVLMVCSDHGFHTWRKSINYNTWLVRHGYMTLKNTDPDTQKNLEDLFGQGQFWPNVDWSRTKAYALGLGDVYLNVKGREAQGIVEPGEEYERIRNQLIQDIEAYVDPETGDHPVRRALKREQVYSKYDPNLIPDVILANDDKYRVSWQTSLGGIPPHILQLNARKWSGDHCSFDAEITKGIFFANRKLDVSGGINIMDLYPTILNYLGVPVPDSLDGKAMRPID
jgi:predicted AlkP superfamily phosphohydrolase/phosphomutase